MAIKGEKAGAGRLSFPGFQKSLQPQNKRCLLLGRKVMTNLDSVLKSRDITLQKSLYSQSYGFSSSHVWMWELDHKEGGSSKNWCFQIVKTLESPLDCSGIQLVNSRGNRPWIFIGRTVAEAPIFWPPDAKSWLIGKHLDVGKDWGQEENGAQRRRRFYSTTNSMDINLSKFLGHSEEQGRLASCSHGWAGAGGCVCHRVRHHLATEQHSLSLLLQSRAKPIGSRRTL